MVMVKVILKLVNVTIPETLSFRQTSSFEKLKTTQ